MDSFRTFIAIEIPRNLRAQVIQHIHQLRHQAPNARASWAREDNLHLTLRFLGNVPITGIPQVSAAVERATKTISPFELSVSGCGVFPPRGRPNVLWLGMGTHASGVPVSQHPARTSFDDGEGSAGILPAGRGHLARTYSDEPATGSSSSAILPQSEVGSSRHPTPNTPHPILSALHASLETELATAGFPPEPRPFHPHLTIARLRHPHDARELAELHNSLGFAPQSFSVSEIVIFRSELLKEGSKHIALSRHELGLSLVNRKW